MFYYVRIIISILFCCFSLSACTVPKKNLWPRWQANNPASHKTVDHSLWQQFLNDNILTNNQGLHLIRYGNISQNDRKILREYLEEMSNIDIDNYNREEQLAYWINLYNSLTIDIILQHYPVKSILKISISPGWFSIGPWDAKLIKVKGESLSLNDIEQRIIRPIWNDPRTHYALNCASYSCPDLQKTAFTGKNLDRLLGEAAIEYINDPRGVKIQNGKLIVSKIYIWYQTDFGKTDQDIINHLMKYAKPNLKEKLKMIHKIDDSQYNWSLNDALLTPK